MGLCSDFDFSLCFRDLYTSKPVQCSDISKNVSIMRTIKPVESFVIFRPVCSVSQPIYCNPVMYGSGGCTEGLVNFIRSFTKGVHFVGADLQATVTSRFVLKKSNVWEKMFLKISIGQKTRTV